jgi:hypothetical protein
MTNVQIRTNPFALMVNPEAILAALAGSDRLARLESRVCRPLDKATVIGRGEDDADPAPESEGPDEA